jgi:DNA-binding transcriptional MerR regulator
MNIKEVATLLGTAGNTIRRWCDDYHRFLSPGAHPPKGQTRILDSHDLRVLHFVSASRDIGREPESILAHLEAMQAEDWESLPEVPPDWLQPSEQVTTTVATKLGYDAAHIAVMQRDLEHAQNALVEAEERVNTLETELDTLRADSGTKDEKIHALELQLSDSRGEVQALKTQIEAFTLAYGMGRDRPLPIAAIILVTALIVAALVIILLVVVRLVL